MSRKRSGDVVDSILQIGAELRKQYRTRQTIAGPIRQALPETKPPRGMNRKNMLRRLRKPAAAKVSKPAKIPRLVEHTETDSQGRQITRFFGDPMACWGQFTSNPPKLVEPHGAARDNTIRQMHAAGLKDQQIANTLRVAAKTVERALKGHRKRARTRKKR